MRQQDIDYLDKLGDSMEMGDPDIKISPEFYIHNAIVKAQNALVGADDYKTGVLKFVALIQNAEVIAKASGLLPDDFNKRIKEFREEAKKDGLDGTNEYFVALSNKKLELIITKVNESKPQSMNFGI